MPTDRGFGDGTCAPGAVAELFSMIARLNSAENFAGNLSITLIGHSMGTMVANEIVEAYP